MTRDRGWGKTVLGVIFTALMLFPLYWMINVSLTPTNRLQRKPPDLLPTHATFDGYRTVLHEQGAYLATSIGVALGVVVLTLLISAPAGFALAKLRPRGGGLLSFLLLIAQMIPTVIIAFGFYAIYLDIEILNTTWGLIVADSTAAVPFAVLIFTAFMSGIPSELLQAARIDGAGSFRISAPSFSRCPATPS